MKGSDSRRDICTKKWVDTRPKERLVQGENTRKLLLEISEEVASVKL